MTGTIYIYVTGTIYIYVTGTTYIYVTGTIYIQYVAQLVSSQFPKQNKNNLECDEHELISLLWYRRILKTFLVAFYIFSPLDIPCTTS